MSLRTFLLSPGRTVIAAILCTTFIGALLLALPWSQKEAVSFIDCLFTATSAMSVTGLLTVPLSSFTTFGQTIIMCLIQIGGLGVVTLSVFFISLFVEVGLSAHTIAGQALEIDNWKSAKKLIGFIIWLTLISELIGTIFTFTLLKDHYPLGQAWFMAFFHAISAFCNAGFSLFEGGMMSWRTNIPMLLITALLVLIGEIGFITWHELTHYFTSLREKKWHHLSLNTKLVLQTSAIIIGGTSIIFWLLEKSRSFAGLSHTTQALNVVFNAISARSAGFTTMDFAFTHLATVLALLVVAFIGSSPGSTGSGIKTTTFAIFIAAVRAVIAGKTVVETNGRRIPMDQVFKAMAILSLSLCWIIVTTFFMLLLEPGLSFLALLFEAVSAFVNLGISLGITSSLATLSKIVLIISMMVGRIGSLTLLLAIKRHHDRVADFTYPEERVMLG